MQTLLIILFYCKRSIFNDNRRHGNVAHLNLVINTQKSFQTGLVWTSCPHGYFNNMLLYSVLYWMG